MDRKQNDERNTQGQDKEPSEAEVKAPRKTVSQIDFAKGLRQAIITAGLREGFRMAFKATMSTLFGVEIDVEPQTLELPEVDDLFDDIDVIEPTENADPE